MTLRVAQVNCVLDAERREPEALLAAWPTLPAVAEATAQAGGEVVVVQASHRTAHFLRRGVRYHFVPVASSRAFAPWNLRRAVQDAIPDVVHLNGLDFPFHARALSALSAPVLVQDHASQADQPRLHGLRRWGHARTAGVVFTAAEQAAPFLATRQLPAHAPVFTVPESSSRFAPGNQAEARARTGVYGDPAILWVGRLDANKDPATALDAFRLAREKLPGAELWCAFGADALRAELKQSLAADPVLARHVHLLGSVPHAGVEQLCRACDLYLATSHREGSGYALIEALACGLPPVVSDIASFRALIGDLRHSRFATPGDARAFADGLVFLGTAPGDRDEVRRHFDTHLAFPVIGRQLIGIYKTVVARAARA